MNSSKAELATALRERLAIVADESSRRDPSEHHGRLKDRFRNRLQYWEKHSRRQSIHNSRIFSHDAVTIRR